MGEGGGSEEIAFRPCQEIRMHYVAVQPFQTLASRFWCSAVTLEVLSASRDCKGNTPISPHEAWGWQQKYTLSLHPMLISD
jgi:hypothetical protein